MVVTSRAKNADNGNHRTSNSPTLLLQSAGDEKSNPAAVGDRQSGLETAESMSARSRALWGRCAIEIGLGGRRFGDDDGVRCGMAEKRRRPSSKSRGSLLALLRFFPRTGTVRDTCSDLDPLLSQNNQ